MTNISFDEAALLGKLTGKTVIVTGGANGIGKATTLMLHKYGANVVIADVADKDGEILQNGLGTRAIYAHADVSSWSDMTRLFETARQLGNGRIDIVVANAGLMERTNFLDDRLDDRGFLEEPDYNTLDVNLKGCLNSKFLYSLRSATLGSPAFQRQNLLSINSVSRGAVHWSSCLPYQVISVVEMYCSIRPQNMEYALVDFCSISLTKTLQVIGVLRGTADHASDLGARVNAIAPFMVETQMTSGFRNDSIFSGIPANKPEHVAQAICIAATDCNMNGSTLWVSGGKISEVEQCLMALAEQWVGKENWHILQMWKSLTSKGYKLPSGPREV